jgi:hypothetical protein
MNEINATKPRPRRAVLLFLAVALTLVIVRFAVLVKLALPYPYELDYGEGINWQQMRMLVAGQGYAPLAPYPAMIFHYPPLALLLAAGLASTGIDELLAGRLMATMFALISVALAGMVTVQLDRRPDGRWGGLVTAASLLGTLPFLIWSVIFRVDMPFLALSFAGLLLGMRALQRPALVHAAALCFAAAIYAKQTALAAPVAVFAVLWLVRPRVALAGMATGLAAAGLALVAISAATHGEFLRQIVTYNINKLSAVAGQDIPVVTGMHFGLLAAAVIGFGPRFRAMVRMARGQGWLKLWRADPSQAQLAMVAIYLALATAMLAMVFKTGSAVNYFLEWTTLVAIGAGLGVADFVRRSRTGAFDLWRAAAPCLVAAQALASWALFEDDYPQRAAQRPDLDRLAAAIRAAPGPIFSDDMVIVLRSGKPMVLEPAVFYEAPEQGILDDRPVLDMLARHAFSLVMTEGSPGDPLFDSRYTPKMAKAILDSYPRKIELSNDYVVRLPAGQLPAWAAPLAARAKSQNEAD